MAAEAIAQCRGTRHGLVSCGWGMSARVWEGRWSGTAGYYTGTEACPVQLGLCWQGCGGAYLAVPWCGGWEDSALCQRQKSSFAKVIECALEPEQVLLHLNVCMEGVSVCEEGAFACTAGWEWCLVAKGSHS